MDTNNNLPKRKSPRLLGYDYTLPGGYFITVATHHHIHLFGKVINGEMCLNEVGKMIQDCWWDIPKHYPNTTLDVFIVMPNHIHGILFITEPNVGEGLVPSRQSQQKKNDTSVRATTRVAPTLSQFVGSFKSKTTNKYIQGVKEMNWPPFHKRIWQRSFYDRIIRYDDELHKFRDYIHNNVLK